MDMSTAHSVLDVLPLTFCFPVCPAEKSLREMSLLKSDQSSWTLVLFILYLCLVFAWAHHTSFWIMITVLHLRVCWIIAKCCVCVFYFVSAENNEVHYVSLKVCTLLKLSISPLLGRLLAKHKVDRDDPVMNLVTAIELWLVVCPPFGLPNHYCRNMQWT